MENLFLLLPLALLALLFFSSSRRRREAVAVQSTLAPGSEIVTTAGLYATVVAVEDVAVVLEVSPGVHTRWARAAVARVVTTPVDATDPDPDLAAASGPAGSSPAGSSLADDVPGGAVPDDLAALDPDRDAEHGGRGTDRPSGGAVRADGPDLTKRDRDADGGARP